MAADVAVVGGAVTVDCVVTGMVVKTVPPVVVSVSSEGIVIWNWLVSSYNRGAQRVHTTSVTGTLVALDGWGVSSFLI